MYHLATMDSVTDGQTDSIMLIGNKTTQMIERD